MKPKNRIGGRDRRVRGGVKGSIAHGATAPSESSNLTGGDWEMLHLNPQEARRLGVRRALLRKRMKQQPSAREVLASLPKPRIPKPKDRGDAA
ncbi:MAG: hypothetical protein ACQGVC_18150 [Myxococcota bacterium]